MEHSFLDQPSEDSIQQPLAQMSAEDVFREIRSLEKQWSEVEGEEIRKVCSRHLEIYGSLSVKSADDYFRWLRTDVDEQFTDATFNLADLYFQPFELNSTYCDPTKVGDYDGHEFFKRFIITARAKNFSTRDAASKGQFNFGSIIAKWQLTLYLKRVEHFGEQALGVEDPKSFRMRLVPTLLLVPESYIAQHYLFDLRDSFTSTDEAITHANKMVTPKNPSSHDSGKTVIPIANFLFSQTADHSKPKFPCWFMEINVLTNSCQKVQEKWQQSTTKLAELRTVCQSNEKDPATGQLGVCQAITPHGGILAIPFDFVDWGLKKAGNSDLKKAKFTFVIWKTASAAMASSFEGTSRMATGKYLDFTPIKKEVEEEDGDGNNVSNDLSHKKATTK